MHWSEIRRVPDTRKKAHLLDRNPQENRNISFPEQMFETIKLRRVGTGKRGGKAFGLNFVISNTDNVCTLFR